MAEKSKRALLISTDGKARQRWSTALEKAGWQVFSSSASGNLQSSLQELQPAVAVVEGTTSELGLPDQAQDQELRPRGTPILPVVTAPSPEQIVDLFRRGAVDVLTKPFDEVELLAAVERASHYRDLSRENLEYRSRLEKANRELHESLNILKMDQIAGRQVQQSMLPPTPLCHGEYVIAHRIVPSLYLSGDFVGYNTVFDRYLVFYFADVSGHGASSAFVTVLLRFILRRILRRHVQSRDHKAMARAPEGFVEHINRQILATGLDKHLTIFAGAVDMERNMLRYVTGAQLPMPVFVAGDDARFLPGEGKPVGLFEDALWEVQEIALPKSFSLVIASDGLLDFLPGNSIEAKEQALLRAVACRKGQDHEGIFTALGVDNVKDAPDDVSVLTITRNS